MRRCALIFASCVCLQLAVASPAHAWWDYIEQFSGPGPFWPAAFDVEGRLLCFGVEPKATSRVQASKAVEISTAGGKFSLCLNWLKDPTPPRRIASLDLGFRYATDRDRNFANNERIHFMTLEPAFSVSPIPSEKLDVVEYGIGAGFYWFRSEGFPRNFSNDFVEPVRFDFRLPSNIRLNPNAPVAQKILARLFFRAGWLLFPDGFDPEAFAPAPGFAKPQSKETVRYYAVFFDFEGLFGS